MNSPYSVGGAKTWEGWGGVFVCWKDKGLPLMPGGGDFCRADTHTPLWLWLCDLWSSVHSTWRLRQTEWDLCKRRKCDASLRLHCCQDCAFLEVPLLFWLLWTLFSPKSGVLFILFYFFSCGKWFALSVLHPGAAGTYWMCTRRFLNHRHQH